MLVPKCVELRCFDMGLYIAAGKELELTAYIWQPPGSDDIRMDSYRPVNQTLEGWERITALLKWADDVDPGRIKRTEYCKKVWRSRQPGQEIVHLTVKTACNLSL